MWLIVWIFRGMQYLNIFFINNKVFENFSYKFSPGVTILKEEWLLENQRF